ncbi:MAG: glycosyltransferase [Chitinophagaceae bacterium]|nr:glycosyltransferase [Chitinophagaceae bacterium]
MLALTLICLLLMTLYGGLIVYYRWAWKTVPAWSPPAGAQPFRTHITVLVPARNEEKNIGVCLAAISLQTYPRELYEVIVIDDHSTDGTAGLVKTFAATAPFSLITLSLADHTISAGAGDPPIRAHKKFAIETGIAAAKGDLIVTTDADCWSDPNWLATIASYHETTGAKFIAAPVRIGPGPRNLLYLLQTLDFITLQGITAASVSRKFHSMCNGANLAYEKKAFLEVEGFKDIDQLPSGDDMLLMHKIYKKYPGKVFFLKSRMAIVSTQPEKTWKGFVNQRIRWASKAANYDDRRIFWVLLLVYLVNLLFPLLLLASWWNNWYLWSLLMLGLVKTFVEYPFVRSVAGFFGQQRLMIYFPALQPLHIAYTVIVGWLGQFGSYRWKDRKINK